MYPLFTQADGLSNVPLGLLFNLHELMLVNGTSRLILPGANKT
jgi:hypothetical protein